MVPPNRLVALATPFAAPVAAYATAWAAKNIPGVELDEMQLEAIFIAGLAAVLVPAAQWLHGWQKHEAREAEHEHAIELAVADGGVVVADGAGAPAADFEDEADFDDEEFEEFADIQDESDDLDDLDDELFADEQLAEHRS
jgi:hypothetical protein